MGVASGAGKSGYIKIIWNGGGGSSWTAALASTQTFSGADTFQSSATFASTAVFSGAVFVASSAYAAGPVSESTFTVLGSATGTNLGTYDCVPGSTVTAQVAMASSSIVASFSGTGYIGASNGFANTILLDGAPPVNGKSTPWVPGVNISVNLSMQMLFKNVTAGLHNFCLVIALGSSPGTWTLNNGLLMTQTLK